MIFSVRLRLACRGNAAHYYIFIDSLWNVCSCKFVNVWTVPRKLHWVLFFLSGFRWSKSCSRRRTRGRPRIWAHLWKLSFWTSRLCRPASFHRLCCFCSKQRGPQHPGPSQGHPNKAASFHLTVYENINHYMYLMRKSVCFVVRYVGKMLFFVFFLSDLSDADDVAASETPDFDCVEEANNPYDQTRWSHRLNKNKNTRSCFLI